MENNKNGESDRVIASKNDTGTFLKVIFSENINLLQVHNPFTAIYNLVAYWHKNY